MRWGEPDGREPDPLGQEFATRLRAILASAPGSAVRFVEDPASLSISPRWDAPSALTLLIQARGYSEAGRCIGRRRGVSDHLQALAQRLGGLLVRLEVREIG